jgi:rhodanese-related sulfurtransferase
MKRIPSILCIAATLFAAPAFAYDEGLAESYGAFFGSFHEQQVPKALHQMTPEKIMEAIKRGDAIVLMDVRTEQEQAIIGITYPNSLSMPMDQVFKPENLARIPTDKPVVVTCQSGVRCTVIALALRNIGFDNVYAMKGGLAGLMQYLNAKTAF